MSQETLSNVLKKNTQEWIVTHHFGEIFLHPNFEERFMQIAEAGKSITVSTNAILLERNLEKLSKIPTSIDITLSAHQWMSYDNVFNSDEYFRKLKEFQRRVIGTNITVSKVYNVSETGSSYFHRWDKGDDYEWDYQGRCFFLFGNHCVILWNGDVATCCADYDGESVIGNINDTDFSFEDRKSVPWSACRKCDIFYGDKISSRK